MPLFSCKLATTVDKLALPHRSPKPKKVPCTWEAPASTAMMELATAMPAVIVGMDAHRQLRKRLCHSLGNPRDFIGEASAVGVAQSQARGAALLGRPQGFHGKFRIFLVAVEEMLGVKKHPLAPAGQIAAGILDHAQVFLQGRAQDLSHMKVPAFAEHRHDRGVGGKQRPVLPSSSALIPLRRVEPKPQAGVLPLGFVDPPEKLQVLGVRARVSRLDKRNPQLIQLLYDSQLILHGKGNSLSGLRLSG